MLEFGPERWRSDVGLLAAQLDSRPSPALVTHLYDREACSRGASGESSNPSKYSHSSRPGFSTQTMIASLRIVFEKYIGSLGEQLGGKAKVGVVHKDGFAAVSCS